jgi:hypothetical protein
MTFPFAPGTWFDRGVDPTDWGFTAEMLTLALLAATVLARRHRAFLAGSRRARPRSTRAVHAVREESD